MVTMLVNAFGLGESDKILPFNDKGEIHNYARGFVARANELGLVQVILIILSDRLIILPLQKPQLLFINISITEF